MHHKKDDHPPDMSRAALPPLPAIAADAYSVDLVKELRDRLRAAESRERELHHHLIFHLQEKDVLLNQVTELQKVCERLVRSQGIQPAAAAAIQQQPPLGLMQQQQQQQQPRQVGGSTSSSFFPFLPSLPPPASHLVPHHNNSHHNSVALIDNSKRDGAAGAAVVTVVPNGYNDMMMTGIGYPFPDGGNPLASANANGSATAGAGVSVNGWGAAVGVVPRARQERGPAIDIPLLLREKGGHIRVSELWEEYRAMFGATQYTLRDMFAMVQGGSIPGVVHEPPAGIRLLPSSAGGLTSPSADNVTTITAAAINGAGVAASAGVAAADTAMDGAYGGGDRGGGEGGGGGGVGGGAAGDSDDWPMRSSSWEQQSNNNSPPRQKQEGREKTVIGEEDSSNFQQEKSVPGEISSSYHPSGGADGVEAGGEEVGGGVYDAGTVTGSAGGWGAPSARDGGKFVNASNGSGGGGRSRPLTREGAGGGRGGVKRSREVDWRELTRNLNVLLLKEEAGLSARDLHIGFTQRFRKSPFLDGVPIRYAVTSGWLKGVCFDAVNRVFNLVVRVPHGNREAPPDDDDHEDSKRARSLPSSTDRQGMEGRGEGSPPSSGPAVVAWKLLSREFREILASGPLEPREVHVRYTREVKKRLILGDTTMRDAVHDGLLEGITVERTTRRLMVDPGYKS